MSRNPETLARPRTVVPRAIPLMRFAARLDPEAYDCRLSKAIHSLRHGIREAKVLYRVFRMYPDTIPSEVSPENALLGAMLHDIGKIVSHYDYSNGPLGKKERQEHVFMGEQALRAYEETTGVEVPGEVFDAVSKHHEKINGSGYRGESGDALGFVGEWMSIIDPLVSMCEVREYNGTHPVYSFMSAWQSLSEQDGTYKKEKLEKLLAIFGNHPNAHEPGLKWLEMNTISVQ